MNPKCTITNAIAAVLTLIERARGFLEAATLSDEWILAMGERALLLEAHQLATNSRHDLRQRARRMSNPTPLNRLYTAAPNS